MKINYLKIFISVFLIIINVVVYYNIGKLGEYAQGSNIYLYFTILGYIWLFFISWLLLRMIWEEV